MGKRAEAEVAEIETPELVSKKNKKQKLLAETAAEEIEVEAPKKEKKEKKEKKQKAAEAEAEEQAAAEAPKEKKKKKKAAEAEAEAEAPAEEAAANAEGSKKEKKKKKKQAEAEAAAAAEEQAAAEAEEPKKEKKKKKKQAEEEAAAEGAEAEAEAPKKEKKDKKEKKEAAEEEKEAPKKPADADAGADAESLTVFVGGLPFSCTEETLRKDFSECGEIEKMKMLLNEEGSSRGIAFITYKSKEGVDAALKFDGDDYGGRYLKVNIAGDKGKGKGKDGKGKDGKGKGKGNSEFEVFVGGLPWSTEEAAFRKDFEECGEIENLRLPLNDEGKPRGIAFITYKNKEAVDKALAFDGTDYGGRTLKVNKAGEGGKGKDGKGKDGKGKGKDGKGKKGKDGKGKSKGKSKTPEFEGKKQTFDDSDDEPAPKKAKTEAAKPADDSDSE